MSEFPTTPPIPRADIENLAASTERRFTNAAVLPYVAKHVITPITAPDLTNWDVAANGVSASMTMDRDVDLFVQNVQDGQTFCLFSQTSGTGRILYMLFDVDGTMVASQLGEDELATIAGLPDGSHFVLSGVASGNKVALFLKTFPAD